MRIIINNGNGAKQYAGKWGFLARIIVMTLAVMLVDWLLPGVTVTNVWTAIITAVVIALLNNFIRPVLVVLTLPFTLVSMGLFLFVVNAIIIALASSLVPGFSVQGFGNALLFSLLLTAMNYVLELPNKLLAKQEYENRPPSSAPDLATDDEGFSEYEEVD